VIFTLSHNYEEDLGFLVRILRINKCEINGSVITSNIMIVINICYCNDDFIYFQI